MILFPSSAVYLCLMWERYAILKRSWGFNKKSSRKLHFRLESKFVWLLMERLHLYCYFMHRPWGPFP